MRNPTLPEELLLEIFVRIPAESVGRCRCLSKLWLTNLSTPQFINLHRNRHQQENLLLIFDDAHKLHTIELPLKDDNASKELRRLPRNWKQVFGSCNGLVLLLNEKKYKQVLFVVNPVTQQQVRVPRPPLPYHYDFPSNTIVDQMYGFGYDNSNDDYKILSITTYFQSNNDSHTFAYVYSLKMGVWKSVPCDLRCTRPYLFGLATAGAHVNGVIHWLFRGNNDRRNPFVFATFNLADEAFGVIPFPTDEAFLETWILIVSVLRGCLLITKFGFSGGPEVVEAWIMEQYGIHESWTNLRSIGENELMMLYNDTLLLIDLKTQAKKPVVVDGIRPFFNDLFHFVGSLVSPSSFTLVADEKNDGTDLANSTLEAEAGPSQAPPGSSG